MGTVSSSITAVIMAGGKGTRFGQLGPLQPKCLLPIRTGETLLTRLVNQLRSAGINDVVVCCSVENHSKIEAFLQRSYSAGISPQNVRAISCPNTEMGPLPALLDTLSRISAAWCLLCMADIFFEQAPYDYLSATVTNCPGFDGYLITGTDKMPIDGCGTGAVLCEGKVVRQISYRPSTTGQRPAEEVRQWSGSFLFHAGLIPDLLEHSREYHRAPYEAWIQGLLDRGRRCSWIDAGPFVNVNSTREYESLVNLARDDHEQ